MAHARPWKRLLLALAFLGFAFAVASWIVEGVTPSWVVFPILLAVGLVRARRGGTSGIVLLGLAALVFLLVHIPFVREALSDDCVNPVDSDKACHRVFWLVSLGLLSLLMVLTAVLAFRERGGVWRLPAGAPLPSRALEVRDLGDPGPHQRCERAPGAGARSVLVASRED